MSPSLLTDWLNETVPLFPPPGVVAWNFNIAETGSDYVIELIGASGYDAQDPDWACPPEAWTSRPYQLAGVSEFLCKRFGLQLTEMRSPN